MQQIFCLSGSLLTLFIKYMFENLNVIVNIIGQINECLSSGQSYGMFNAFWIKGKHDGNGMLICRLEQTWELPCRHFYAWA